MALPAHLARYDSLLDLLAERLVAEVLEGTDVKTPAGIHGPAGVCVSTSMDQQPDEYPTADNPAATE
jgi:hypothetical protein